MHETALAKQILTEVLARAEGRSVKRVAGTIAEDEALSHDALVFHFRAHARGTVAASADLSLALRHLTAHCKSCGCSFLPDHHVRLCPSCGSTETELDGEAGVRIENIVVDEP